MASNSNAIATFGWQTGDVATHGLAICLYGWVDDSPLPPEDSRLSPDSMIKEGEFNPTDIRRAFQKLNDILLRRYGVTTTFTASHAGNQGEAQLQMGVTVVDRAFADNDSVTLPPVEANAYVKLINKSGYTLKTYPDTDNAIDEQAVNASVTVVDGEIAVFEGVDDTNWYMMKG